MNNKEDLETDEAEDQAAGELADLVLMKVSTFEHDVDPFEIYIHKVQSRLHSNHPEFKTRLIKGYHVLLKEVKKVA